MINLKNLGGSVISVSWKYEILNFKNQPKFSKNRFVHKQMFNFRKYLNLPNLFPHKKIFCEINLWGWG